MQQITPQHRLLLAVEPVDFRKGIDGLKALCRKKLLDDPFSGTVFVFTNRMRTSVKLLVYDASGFWLCQKRFSRGKLAWWLSGLSPSVQLRSSELLILRPSHKSKPSRRLALLLMRQVTIRTQP